MFAIEAVAIQTSLLYNRSQDKLHTQDLNDLIESFNKLTKFSV